MVTYTVGKRVFVPGQGLGVVKGFKTIAANGQSQEFIQIEIQQSNVTVMYPIGSEAYNRIREPLNEVSAHAVLDTLRSETSQLRASKERWFKQHKRHIEILNSGDTVRIAELIVFLKSERKARALSYTERKVLDDASRMIQMELSNVFGSAVNSALDLDSIEPLKLAA